MNLSLENKAVVLSLVVVLLSMGATWLTALSIQKTSLSPMPSTPPNSASTPEMITSPELAAQGRNFFEQSCSQCHGDDARGDEGPDLHNLTISNARIASTIKKGIKGEMPTFAKKYDDKQIAVIVSYLRSLR